MASYINLLALLAYLGAHTNLLRIIIAGVVQKVWSCLYQKLHKDGVKNTYIEHSERHRSDPIWQRGKTAETSVLRLQKIWD